MSKLTLYELADEYQRLMDYATIDSDEGNVGLSEEYIQLLESIEGKIQDKAEGCCRAIKSMLSLKDSIDEEVAKLRSRANRLDKTITGIKDYVKFHLEQMQITKLQAGIFKLSIVNNSQPSVIVLDLDSVPTKFDKPVERQVSLTAIRDAVKSGEEVPGVSVERGNHLRIS